MDEANDSTTANASSRATLDEPRPEQPDHAVGDYPKASPYRARTVMYHVIGAACEFAVLAWAVAWIVSHASLPGSGVALLAGAAVGLFVADAISGILHWMFDTWFFPAHPLFERMVLIVREHHLAPLAMFKYPFYHDAGMLSWIMLLVTGPFLIPTLCAAGAPSLFALAAVGATVVTSLCVVFMLEFHKCGHRRSAPGVRRLLQRCHLVLDPRHHAQHHRAPYTEKYCIVTGWANPVLDDIGFFRGLERLINAWTGAVPRQSDRDFMARYGRTPRRDARVEG